VNERMAQRWFKHFESGNLSLEDEQSPGRPRIWDSEATKEAAEQQPSTSMRRLSYTLDLSEYYSLSSNNSRRNLPHELTAE
jgi:hypothetical protein